MAEVVVSNATRRARLPQDFDRKEAPMANRSDLDFGSHRELTPPPHIDETFLPAWRALEAERVKLAKAAPKLNKAVTDSKREAEAANRRSADAFEKRRIAQATFDKITEQKQALVRN